MFKSVALQVYQFRHLEISHMLQKVGPLQIKSFNMIGLCMSGQVFYKAEPNQHE